MPRVQDTSTPPHAAHGSWDLTRACIGGGADYDLGPALGLKGKGAGKGGQGALVMQLAQSPSDAQQFRLSFSLGNTLMTGVTVTVGADGTETLQ
eukprot:429333-Amphidinium_carterae.1